MRGSVLGRPDRRPVHLSLPFLCLYLHVDAPNSAPSAMTLCPTCAVHARRVIVLTMRTFTQRTRAPRATLSRPCRAYPRTAAPFTPRVTSRASAKSAWNRCAPAATATPTTRWRSFLYTMACKPRWTTCTRVCSGAKGTCRPACPRPRRRSTRSGGTRSRRAP